jgi:hypothetical protein
MSDKQTSHNNLGGVLESVVILAIIAVLIQTFLQDLAILLGWPWDLRKALLFAGFGFDLFFSLEFLTRLYLAMLNRQTGVYLFRDRGWIDFLASIPLLTLNSGPAALGILAGGVTVLGMGGMVNVLKVVKAIRIARILRLLRVLKIFARIKHTDSVMAQRHVAKISATAVSSIIFVLLAASFVWSFLELPSFETNYREDVVAYVELDQELDAAETRAAVAEAEPGVLVLKSEGRSLFSRHDNEYYESYFGPGDYDVLEIGGTQLFVDLRPLNASDARENLIHFVIIVVIVLVFLFGYSPHFALTVSDPIHVMRRGFAEPTYNLAVKIAEPYKDDEVYRLAAQYNEVFLPMKDRSSGSASGNSELSMDDIQDAFE